MAANEGADPGNPGNTGSGAPDGGSPQGGSDNDSDKKFDERIKAALASQRQRYEEQLTGLRAEFEAYKAGAGTKKQDDQAPKRYTRPELRSLVDSGKITQEQADDQWALQVREEAREEASAVALDTVTRKQTKERIDSDIAAYVRLKPEIKESGSDVREKIRDEFNYLVSIGKPADTSTELAAIRAVLGPVDKLQKAASASRAQDHDQQGGGSEGAGGGPKGGGQKKLHQYLTGENKAYYERGIKQGRYKDWDAVDAELKYARPSVRQRLGLPA